MCTLSKRCARCRVELDSPRKKYCAECRKVVHREASRAYVAAHREQYRVYSKQYQHNHREKIRVKNRKYYEKIKSTPELRAKNTEYQRQYRQKIYADPEAHDRYKTRYRKYASKYRTRRRNDPVLKALKEQEQTELKAAQAAIRAKYNKERERLKESERAKSI